MESKKLHFDLLKVGTDNGCLVVGTKAQYVSCSDRYDNVFIQIDLKGNLILEGDKIISLKIYLEDSPFEESILEKFEDIRIGRDYTFVYKKKYWLWGEKIRMVKFKTGNYIYKKRKHEKIVTSNFRFIGE